MPHLILAGPSVAGVADDPEGGEVFGLLIDRADDLDTRKRVIRDVLGLRSLGQYADLLARLASG